MPGRASPRAYDPAMIQYSCPRCKRVYSFGRCRECIKVDKRIQIAKSSLDQVSREVWDKMSIARQIEVRKEAHKLKGKSLRTKMCAQIRQEIKSNLSKLLKLTMGFADECIFQDSPKLGDRYKSHLQCINAKIFEDMDYRSGHKKRKFDVLTEDTIRGTPKAKAAPKTKTSGPERADPNKLASSQGIEHDEWLKFMNTSALMLRSLKEGILELGEWLPPATKDNLALLEASHHNKTAVCDTVKETGECMLAFKKEFSEEILMIHQQVKVAQHFRIICAKSKAVNNR